MLTLVAAALLFAHPTPPDVSLFISPKGNDSWPGTKKAPFRTLEKARNAVLLALSAHPDRHETAVVTLEKGTYELDKPLRLELADSVPNGRLTFDGQGATVSGGRRITGLTTDAKGWWHADLPLVRDGKWRFSQIFVNGRRRYRPRFPKEGYYQIAAEVPPTPEAKGHGYDRFGFRTGDLRNDWHNLSDVELLCFHIWDMSRMRIGSIDASSDVVTTAAPTGFDAGWANFPKGNRYIAENVKEALRDPGEWYIDNKTGEFTYIPMPGESIRSAQIVAPMLNHLVEIDGGKDIAHPVQNISFKDISFEYTNWNLPPQGRFSPQAESDLGAAIECANCRGITFDDCSISHTGEYGVWFSRGSSDDTLSNCGLSDLGAGGVKIGETSMHDDPSECAHNIKVTGCEIAHGGRLHPAAIGVWIGQSYGDEVSYNDIFDLYYTGVSIGWTWGYGKSQAHDNVIQRNRIYDIGQGVLSDMGGIYTLGIEPGTKLIGNVLHDIDSFSYGGWGIYFDEGSSNELAEGNVVYRTKSGGLHQHYGQNNTVRNNVFAFGREAELIRTRAEDHLSFTLQDNIVLWKDAPLLGSNWSGNNYLTIADIYWRTDRKPVDFAGMTLAQWQAKGQDIGAEIVDPQFVNPLAGDFRLKPGSPALAHGVKQFEPERAGPARLRGREPRSVEPPAFPRG